jgi:hypothetical protein
MMVKYYIPSGKSVLSKGPKDSYFGKTIAPDILPVSNYCIDGASVCFKINDTEYKAFRTVVLPIQIRDGLTSDEQKLATYFAQKPASLNVLLYRGTQHMKRYPSFDLVRFIKWASNESPSAIKSFTGYPDITKLTKRSKTEHRHRDRYGTSWMFDSDCYKDELDWFCEMEKFEQYRRDDMRKEKEFIDSVFGDGAHTGVEYTVSSIINKAVETMYLGG